MWMAVNEDMYLKIVKDQETEEKVHNEPQQMNNLPPKMKVP